MTNRGNKLKLRARRNCFFGNIPKATWVMIRVRRLRITSDESYSLIDAITAQNPLKTIKKTLIVHALKF